MRPRTSAIPAQGSAVDWTSRVMHAAPAGQPDSVAQITARLFPAYTVDGGRVHLAGCTLEDRLFVRLGCRLDGQAADRYVDAVGGDMPAEQVAALGLDHVVRLGKASPSAQPVIARFLASGLPAVEQRLAAGGSFECLSITAIWCKFAEGKLRFTIGSRSADLAFADWARTLEPPPFVCPHSGAHGFHLAATDDGRITLAEQIAACQQTGRRVLLNELVSCAATGRRVLAELTTLCPASGQRVLSEALVACPMCGQPVSPTAIEHGRCVACRTLRPAGKGHPIVAQLVARYPALDRWPDWRLAETASVYICVAAGWLRQLLLVVDKESLELRQVATGTRLHPAWQRVEPAEYEPAMGA